MASSSFDVDLILEVVLRGGSDLEDKESWEVCFEDQTWIIADYLLSTDQANDLESLNSFHRWAVSRKNRSDLKRHEVPSRLPHNEDPEVRKNFKLNSFIV